MGSFILKLSHLNIIHQVFKALIAEPGYRRARVTVFLSGVCTIAVIVLRYICYVFIGFSIFKIKIDQDFKILI